MVCIIFAALIMIIVASYLFYRKIDVDDHSEFFCPCYILDKFDESDISVDTVSFELIKVMDF